MKEFTFETIQEHIGLRPNEKVAKRASFLTRAENVRMTEYGIEGYVGVVNPINPLMPISFPNPQLLRLQSDTLILSHVTNSGVVYRVNEGTDPWGIIPVNAFAYDSVMDTQAIPLAGQWHVADFPDSFYAFNGASVLFRVQEVLDKFLVQTDIHINTGCAFRGRVVCGGFDPTKVWSEVWLDLFEELLDDEDAAPLQDIGRNWVMWSSIGGGDFPLWLFYPNVESDSGPSVENFLERAKRNEFGFMPMSWKGEVMCVKALGNGVMVYGQDGISVLSANQQVADLPSTFGLQEVEMVGIPQRDCVGGDDASHLFIDHSGSLWSVGPDNKATRLGYEEFFYPMLGGPIRITKDAQRREFRICSDDAGFLLTPQGLTEHRQRVTSSFYFGGGAVGIFEVDDEMDGVLIVGPPFDMNNPSIKTVTSLSVFASSGLNIVTEDYYSIFVALDFRYNRNEPWMRSEYVVTNLEGNARVNVSGLEFRMVVMCPSYIDFEMDLAQVRWHKTDKRVTRGPDADPSVTGAGE